MLDYVIVGGGLAGSVLSEYLKKHTNNFKLIDSKDPKASAVAGGLFNPLVFRRLTKSWYADLLFPFAFKFYESLEQSTGEIINHIPMQKTIETFENLNLWESKRTEEEFKKYMKPTSNAVFSGLKNPLSWGEVTHTGTVKVKVLLEKLHTSLKHNNQLMVTTSKPIIEEKEDHLKLKVNRETINTKHVIYCEGPYGINNQFFSYLPFSLTKGEILTVKSSSLNPNFIFKRHYFILPMGNDIFKIGATYNWNDLSWNVSEEGKSILIEKLEEMVESEYKIIKHEVGVRPTTRDRKPFIGTHPTKSRLHIFNGLGSKGVMIAPYFADQLCRYLFQKEPIDKAVNISRYQNYFKG